MLHWIALTLVLGAETVGEPSPRALLEQGNERFIAGASVHPNATLARVAETAANGQHPFATILCCSDSRVPVDHVFDRGIGDLFVVRVAGNVADTDEIGSVEYGVGHLHTPYLLVLGHTKCGAVTAVVTGAEVGGSIPELVDNIAPAAAAAAAQHPELSGEQVVPAAIEANVWQGIADLFARSHEIRELASGGELVVEGAIYDIGTGTVSWLGRHPEEAKLLGAGGGHETAHEGAEEPAVGDHGEAGGHAADGGHAPAVESGVSRRKVRAGTAGHPASEGMSTLRVVGFGLGVLVAGAATFFLVMFLGKSE